MFNVCYHLLVFNYQMRLQSRQMDRTNFEADNVWILWFKKKILLKLVSSGLVQYFKLKALCYMWSYRRPGLTNLFFFFLFLSGGGGGGGRSHSPASFMKIVHKMTVTVRIKYIKYFNKGFGVALRNNLALYSILERL